MSALDTVTDYISDVRTLLLDVIQPYRYDDPSLITALNLALLEGRRLRPDLFVYNKKDEQIQTFTTVDISKVKMEPPFRLAFVYGTCAHALARDQEDVQDQRAATFMATFRYMLTGERAAPQVAGGGPPQQQGR